MEGRFGCLAWHTQGAVTIVELDRPPVNAVNDQAYKEIYSFFIDLAHVPNTTRAIVLTGRGKHFCAGADLSEFEVMTSAVARVNSFHVREAFNAIYACPVPVVGAVNGVALGAGLAIAGSCDVVIAAKNASFGLPELSVGVAGGAKHLSRMVPQNMVRAMFFTAEPVSARVMFEKGGVWTVVPPDQLVESATELASKMARHSPVALRRAKRVLNQIESMELRRGYELEQEVTIYLADHPDSKEAVNAFREKREPHYRDFPADDDNH